MKSQDQLGKATGAAASTKLLLDTRDTDGTCDQACYVIFDPVRAALLSTYALVVAKIAKTHSGLISAFSLHLAKTGRVPVKLGWLLNKVENFRLIADYQGDPVGSADATWAVQQAQLFFQAMENFHKTA